MLILRKTWLTFGLCNSLLTMHLCSNTALLHSFLNFTMINLPALETCHNSPSCTRQFPWNTGPHFRLCSLFRLLTPVNQFLPVLHLCLEFPAPSPLWSLTQAVCGDRLLLFAIALSNHVLFLGNMSHVSQLSHYFLKQSFSPHCFWCLLVASYTYINVCVVLACFCV